MNNEFWQQKWASNAIGFHLTDVNPLLIKHWCALNLSREDRVFVPLCGKTVDLDWLAQRHDDVIGAELSDIAVRAFFSEHLYTPLVMPQGEHLCYQFDEITLYQGDFFSLNLPEPVNAIYDRAALIAMSPSQRQTYVQHLLAQLKAGGQILLISLEKEQDQQIGPPYCVPESEICQLFDGCELALLSRELEPSPKDPASPWVECVWHIRKPSSIG